MRRSRRDIVPILGTFLLVVVVTLSLLDEGQLDPNSEPRDKADIRQWTRRSILSTNFTCDHCNNFDYEYILHHTCTEEIFLLYLVTIAHNATEAREAIRNSWGSVKSHRDKTIKVVFVLGKHSNEELNDAVDEESKRFGDLIQGDFPDSYRSLTEKVVFGLRWSRSYCPASYVVKTDDDVFHVTQNFVDFLLDTKLPDMFIGGRCLTTKPDRRSYRKSYVNYEVYPYTYSPYYCQGGGYVISSPAIAPILAISTNVNYTPLEDQFVAGICRHHNLIPYVQIPGVLARIDSVTPCTLRARTMSTHKVYPHDMRAMWAIITAENIQCVTALDIQTAGLLGVMIIIWALTVASVFRIPSTSASKTVTSNGHLPS